MGCAPFVLADISISIISKLRTKSVGEVPGRSCNLSAGSRASTASGQLKRPVVSNGCSNETILIVWTLTGLRRLSHNRVTKWRSGCVYFLLASPGAGPLFSAPDEPALWPSPDFGADDEPAGEPLPLVPADGFLA